MIAWSMSYWYASVSDSLLNDGNYIIADSYLKVQDSTFSLLFIFNKYRNG